MNVSDCFIRRQTVIAIDRAVIAIIGVVGVVTPGRIPPAIIPAPVTTIDKDDRVTMVMPPIPAMVMTVVAVMMSGLGEVRDSTVRVP